MSAQRMLRSAVVGAGFIGPMHVDAVRRGGFGQVVVLVGTDLERTRAVADTLGVERATTELDSVLSDPTIDVVHVCTPNQTHVPMGCDVLRAGKHLVMEKPIAVDRAGASLLLDAAAHARRLATVTLTYRGYPMVRRARRLVADGRVGTLRLIHGGYLQDWLSDAGDFNWRLEGAAGGPSRAFADIGTHWFDTAEFIAGVRAEAVMADLATFIPVRRRPTHKNGTAFATGSGPTEDVTIDTEDGATLLVRFEDGARGAVVVSQVSTGHKNGLTVELAGSDRSLGWSQEDPEHLWLRGRDETTLLARGPATNVSRPGVPSLPAGHPEGWAEALRDLLRPFYQAVADGADPPTAGEEAPYPTLTDGARSVAIIDAVLESSRAARWVTISPIADRDSALVGHGVTGGPNG